MGCSYKTQSYINNYKHGDFSSSVVANVSILSSKDSRSEGHVSDLKKATPDNPNFVAKAFSLTTSHFFWPNSDKKLGEVIREWCSWCLSCKAIVSSKKGCMLNHASIYTIKSATKILSRCHTLILDLKILIQISFLFLIFFQFTVFYPAIFFTVLQLRILLFLSLIFMHIRPCKVSFLHLQVVRRFLNHCTFSGILFKIFAKIMKKGILVISCSGIFSPYICL